MNDKLPRASVLTDFFGGSDDAATVNPDDLRKVWRLFRDVQGRSPGCAIDASMYKSVCSPGADVLAVWYRTSLLGLLQMLPESPLTPWMHDGELEDVVFKVAATFPMKKMDVDVGVVHAGPPFDVVEFLKEIGAESSNGTETETADT